MKSRVSDRPWGSGSLPSPRVTDSPHLYPISTGDKQLKKQEKKPALVSPEFVDEALCACKEHLNNLAHMDIDKDIETPLYLSPEGWSLFLQRYYQVVQ